MIDWPKVVQDLERENARLKKDVEQFRMALREQVELNKNLFANAGKMVDYPQWVCNECGTKHGSKAVGLATWHNGVCGVCGKNAAVTEPRDFGHLKDAWKAHSQFSNSKRSAP